MIPGNPAKAASLRSRMIVTTAGVCLLALLVSGVLIHFSLRSSLMRQFDDSLLARAQSLVALVEEDVDHLHLDLDPSLMPAYGARQHQNYFELITADGRDIVASASLGRSHLPHPSTPPAAHVYQTITLFDGRPARMIVVPFLPGDSATTTQPARVITPTPSLLLIATEMRRLDETLWHFTRQIILVCACTTAATAGTLAWLTWRHLRPVRTLADQIARVGRKDLSERLDPGPGVPRELVPVVNRLNEMMSRLSSAFEREKAFTADVAHELRTPISAMEMALEVSASRPREAPDYRQTVTNCLRTVRQMHRLVDQLLTLARAEGGQLKVARRDVALAELLARAFEPFEVRAAEAGLQVLWNVGPSVTLHTDPDLLLPILQNLFDNAVSYSDEHAEVRITFEPGGRGAPSRLTFQNPATELSAGQAQHVFERFWRRDPARGTTPQAHFGVGLPLVQKLMNALGGSAQAEVGPPNLFRLTLSFI